MSSLKISYLRLGDKNVCIVSSKDEFAVQVIYCFLFPFKLKKIFYFRIPLF